LSSPVTIAKQDQKLPVVKIISDSQKRASYRYLIHAIARIRKILENYAQGNRNTVQELLHDRIPGADFNLDNSILNIEQEKPSNIEKICTSFKLSEFELDILLLCVAVEIDPTIGTLCAKAQSNPKAEYPTFNLAIAIFPHHHWDAFTPEAPLRLWRILELGEANTLTSAPLRI
jgi:hypothetical protein